MKLRSVVRVDCYGRFNKHRAQAVHRLRGHEEHHLADELTAALRPMVSCTVG